MELAARGIRTRRTGVLITAVAFALAACSTPGATTTPTAAATGAAPSGAAPSGAAIPADFPLLGAWTTTVTKEDMAAAGVTDPRAQNENSGKFTWTFAPDGTWFQAQESLDGSPINSPVFRGTYTVDGTTIVATTTFPEQYRDAGLHYEFVLEDGAVRFDLLDPPDATLAIIIETHPWVRAG